jgi:saccharopine dehydrogenase-like NADP-dependent oxidoreductase
MPRCEDTISKLKQRHPASQVQTFIADRETVSAAMLRKLGAVIVVDTAGPFQASTRTLAEAAIEAGRHFIDIADARDYVAAFPALDAKARQMGVLAVTGASSTPALSNAVLDTLTMGWQHVESVDIAISPGNRTPRGLSVMRAILSYAGQPVRLLEDGAWRSRPGWSLLHRKLMPGLGGRWLSLCEAPDLDIVPQRFPSIRTVRFFGGLELRLLHLGLSACCLLVPAGLIKSLLPAAAWFLKIANVFQNLGTDRGGMIVEATGLHADGQRVMGKWSLLAEAGDGPNVPILPALALIRRLLEARRIVAGQSAVLVC